MKYNVIFLSGMLSLMLLTGCQDGQSAVSSLADQSAAVSTVGAASSSAASSVPDASELSVPDVSAVEEPSAPVVTVVNVTKSRDELIALAGQGEWSWFDDVVMIGDSVTLKLKNFVAQQRHDDPGYFGGGQFLSSGSLGSGNSLWEVSDKSVHPSYQGEKLLLERSIPMTGAKKVYLMLGVNDIAVYGLEGSVENYKTLLSQIKAAAPEVEFFIQSATPICEGAEVGALTNENLKVYNQMLLEMCQELGLRFVDVASVLRDENGYLPREYCSDPDGMGIHLTDVACQLWLGYLMEDAALSLGQ